MARDGYLCVGDASRLLGVSRQSVHDRIKSGRYRATLTEEGNRKYYEIPIEDIRQDLKSEDFQERPFTGHPLPVDLLRRESDQQLISQLRAMWHSHGDLVRLLEKQLEVKDRRIARLEERVDVLYDDLKAEREKRDGDDKSTVVQTAPDYPSD
jgi:hypothetical protein